MWLRAERHEKVLLASAIMAFATETNLQQRAPKRCYHAATLTVSHVAFDDHRLVVNAGLILPVTPAHHLGLDDLMDCQVDFG